MSIAILRREGFRIWTVHLIAKAFGVLIRINGLPYGSARNEKPVVETTSSFGPRLYGGSHLEEVVVWGEWNGECVRFHKPQTRVIDGSEKPRN